MKVDIAAFYKFSPLPGYREIQPTLLSALKTAGVRGSVLLAEEGINATIAAPGGTIAQVMRKIEQITGIGDIEPKYATADAMPFKRMKVRLKKEIVTIGNVQADPNLKVGTYVDPENWNQLISDPHTIVIDARNAYECRIGTFRNAVDPQTDQFSQFPDYVRQRLHESKKAKIAMFCTGGIRCEKASSFMLHEGFENVFHLKGGILNYLEHVPRQDSLWQGNCFVFDERVAVGHGLVAGDVTMCFGCLEPLTADERKSALFEEGVCCPRCATRLTIEQKQSNRERQRQVTLAEARHQRHLGPE